MKVIKEETMTYLIIREKTYSNGSKFYSVHDQHEDRLIAENKVKGYSLANTEEDTRYLMSVIQEPLKLTKDMEIDDRQLCLQFPEAV
ncbi:MAG: hypothetical protein VW810_00080 [Pelagibacteraceae bacterium]